MKAWAKSCTYSPLTPYYLHPSACLSHGPPLAVFLLFAFQKESSSAMNQRWTDLITQLPDTSSDFCGGLLLLLFYNFIFFIYCLFSAALNLCCCVDFPLVEESVGFSWLQCEGLSFNYWACARKPGSHNCWAHVLQPQKPTDPEACAPQEEKTLQWEASHHKEEQPPLTETCCAQQQRQFSQK